MARLLLGYFNDQNPNKNSFLISYEASTLDDGILEPDQWLAGAFHHKQVPTSLCGSLTLLHRETTGGPPTVNLSSFNILTGTA